jgi:hypothetical protein
MLDTKQLHKKFFSNAYIKGELFKIYTVNGDYIRTFHYVKFLFGGHRRAGKMYDFITSNNEIWIEEIIQTKHDIASILKHEMDEINHMKNMGWNYKKAHANADRVESEFRKATWGKKIDFDFVI